MAGVSVVAAAFGGTVLRLAVAPGEPVRDGALLMVIESMKMEHAIEAPTSGTVESFSVSVGDAVQQGDVLLTFAPSAIEEKAAANTISTAAAATHNEIRPELTELRRRVAGTLDDGRPEATERRHARGRRTARENIEDLCDSGTFEEYGRFVIAAQRARRKSDDLIANTPTDGLIAGLARVNGDLFPPEQARCAVLSYDYTVLAGT
jgi:pyruvate/2-oxoglutarate dehydrogenase complex dihydrolipoamide acyltransferase (E2) component